ncbi:hypothetical protein FDP41_007898 [Naegleria fowleri]|uniref:Uncharacterized protein n=1 Tax=Naegleria fowleri TaxID=5763 RepID=A0A6A5C0L8_NAEFO|nr:uncharacterized protein FDP41_007898 [Naegleria fowleri]KAF0983983.1 hypothetical protein FDP41_007898 [Naegleria fowleri]
MNQLESNNCPKFKVECSLRTLSKNNVDISKKKHNGPIYCIKFSNGNGQYCMSAGGDKIIKLFNPFKSFFVLKEYKGHGYEVFDLDISTDNNFFVSASGDKSVFLWDISTGEVKRRFKEHKGKVNCVKYSNNNEVVISGSYDRTMKIWDMRSSSFKSIQTMNDFQDSVSSIACSDTSILAGCVDGTVHNYDIRMGKLKVDHMGASSIGHVSFTSDFLCYLCSSLDSTISMVEVSSGNILRVFKGHQNEKYQIKHTLSNNDKYVLSGDERGRIFRWDLTTEACEEVIDPDYLLTSSTNASSGIDEIISIDYHPTGRLYRQFGTRYS